MQEALEHYGPPEIFNSDQGSQFTSVDFTDVLKGAGIRISMDGKGRWMDNVFIERLWRSLKYECVYLSEFATARVSTLEQTTENQLSEIRRYLRHRGWLAHEYVDEGVSGATDRRPELDHQHR